MGSYHELVLAITFKDETPLEVIEILKYGLVELANEDTILLDVLSNPPHHPFFENEDWGQLFSMDHVAYFGGESFATLSQDEDHPRKHRFTCRAIVRSTYGLIEPFLHWILPYSDRDGFHGYTRFDETSDNNYLIYLENGKIYYYHANIQQDGDSQVIKYQVSVDGRLLAV